MRTPLQLSSPGQSPSAAAETLSGHHSEHNIPLSASTMHAGFSSTHTHPHCDKMPLQHGWQCSARLAAASQCQRTATQSVRQRFRGPESAVCCSAAAPGATAAVLQLWRAVLLLTSTEPGMLCSRARIGAKLCGIAHNINHIRDYKALQRGCSELALLHQTLNAQQHKADCQTLQDSSKGSHGTAAEWDSQCILSRCLHEQD